MKLSSLESNYGTDGIWLTPRSRISVLVNCDTIERSKSVEFVRNGTTEEIYIQDELNFFFMPIHVTIINN